jgi:hypothetical protein
VHPIERLRFVARAQGVPGDVLAMEATAALMTFADDPAALVAGCRRVLSRQCGCGPLWWACARLLTADDLRRVARETISALEGDTTEAALSIALFGDHDAADHDAGAQESARPQLVRAHAIGDGGAIVDASDLDRMDPDAEPRWLVAGVGVHLSDPMWASLVEHWSAARAGDQDLVPVDRFTHFVGPDGPLPLVALGEADCPVASELFRLAG